MANSKPKVSVIIPALNEERYIRNAIVGLQNQDFKDFETIVVDGGSKDSTVKIAKQHAKVITVKERGVGRARNAGARAARADVLLFLDADTKPSKELVSTYYKAFRKERLAAATGPILPLEQVPLRFRLGYKFVSIIFVKASILFGRPSFIGSNFAVSRYAFSKANGFNDAMITYEDWDLSYRLKRHGKMKYLNNALVHTSARRTRQWGVSGYFAYYIGNIFSYHVMKKTRSDYSPIR